MKPLFLLMLGAMSHSVCMANPCVVVDPYFYNPLASAALIESGVPSESWWQPGGQFLGGSFEPAPCGYGYRATALQDGQVLFPVVWEDRTFPIWAGIMDFRFKISDFQGPVVGAASPAFVRMDDGQNTYGVWLGSDPGFQHFGLLGTAGLGNLAAGPAAGIMEYADLLTMDEWHHAILAWAAGGLPIAGSPQVAVYLDGQLHSVYYESGLGFGTFNPSAQLTLTINDQPFGVTSISDLRIWDLYFGWYMGWEESLRMLENLCEPYVVYCLDAGDTPMTPVLAQNHPNPFNPSTIISFDLAETGHVLLQVYTLNGEKVATLLDGLVSAGSHDVSFGGEGLPSGVYYYRLDASGRSSTKAMTLIR